jgi:hypothetical protein
MDMPGRYRVRTKQIATQKRLMFMRASMSPSGDTPARIVCAALILASLAVLFRIVSIW